MLVRLDPETERLLSCPACSSPLGPIAEGSECRSCAARFETADGIPVLLDAAEVRTQAHKREQAEFFDEDEEFEVTRPHGEARLYRWMMEEKFRRSVARIGPLDRITALTVCGGSGMDAEFLARAGAKVVCSDISLGAARRTRERAKRFGLEIESVVADVESLPFVDRSFDLVYVHDGLHHLECPVDGLREMARVASRWVSVTEPARAAATTAAVKIGVSVETEEAGNPVARMTAEEITGPLSELGFEIVGLDRYAMFYRHRPGPVSRALSARPLFPASARLTSALSSGLGRAGNKIAVQARRAGPG